MISIKYLKKILKKYYRRDSIKKKFSLGSLLFLVVVVFLSIFFIVSALIDITSAFNLLPWLNNILGYLKQITITEIFQITNGQTLIPNSAKNLTIDKVVPITHQLASTLGMLLMQLLNEILGLTTLLVAVVLRTLSIFGRISAIYSWIIVFISLIPTFLL